MRLAAGVLLRIAGGVVAFAVVVTAGAYAAHAVVLVIAAIP